MPTRASYTDLKAIQQMLGHSSIVTTADTAPLRIPARRDDRDPGCGGNQKMQGAMWGRNFWASESITRYNASKNEVVGAVAICAGAAVLIARAVMH
ncbi:MAG TPA: hypothetical protein VI365_29845 [Trebonia sp.]